MGSESARARCAVRRLLLGLGLLSLVLGLGAPAFADVDVSPGWNRPNAVIGAERVVHRKPPVVPVSQSGRGEGRIVKTLECTSTVAIGESPCRDAAPQIVSDDADLTQADILRAVREIGLPRLDVRVQPGTRTLVNAETIFSTDPVPFSRSVQLLGFDVDLDASAVSYTWHHGDGTSRSTASAGRPYPAFDVTHRYRAAQDVRPSVDVTYRVRYRVDGGAWSTLAQTITASGPATSLEVREAAPVLTKP